MPVLVYSSREHKSERITNVYYGVTRDYILASRLIDAILEAKKSKIVVKRDRFTYVPSDGTRKMVIRLKRL
jgi:hypothetical protein